LPKSIKDSIVLMESVDCILSLDISTSGRNGPAHYIRYAQWMTGIGASRPMAVVARPHPKLPLGVDVRLADNNLAGVIGRSRILIRTASQTALATAAATPVAPSSPMPQAPVGLACRVEFVDEMHLNVGWNIRVHGQGNARQGLQQPAPT
jgi:hypothetical protein